MTTTITATSDGASGTASVTVIPPPPRDYSIVGAQFTQNVQDADGSIPMVLSGDAAAVNVLLQAGLRWQVVRDPRRLVPDDNGANDVFPASGSQALSTADVPPLNVRFVPIVLAANGNWVPNATAAAIPEYQRTLRSVHPVGAINAHLGTPFTTQAT